MEWKELISHETLVKRQKVSSVWEKYPINSFEKDYREVITSEAFRNLQNKTQIFSLIDSGIARTRLTHSLEVSSVAKQLGTMICDNNRKDITDGFGGEIGLYTQDISMILACAGLLHDLGNPAFGHFGEASFGRFFKKYFSENQNCFKSRPVAEYLSDAMKADLMNFDGNAQTIHLLLSNSSGVGRWGINVSYSVINTLIKYPGGSLEIDKKNPDIRKHKFGYYVADEKLYKEVRSAVGMSGISRYPLTYLLEAADDISYLLSDMQDSIAMGVISPWMVIGEFEKMLKAKEKNGSESDEIRYMTAENLIDSLKRDLDKASNDEEMMIAMNLWFNEVRDWLIYSAAHAWFLNYDDIMDGTFTGELLDGSWHDFIIKMIRSLMIKYVYPSRTVVTQEIMGHKLLESLLERFVTAVLYFGVEDDKYAPGPVENRFIWYLPEYLKSDYMKNRTGDEGVDLYLRLLMVTDYISSLTDSEVKKLGEMV